MARLFARLRGGLDSRRNTHESIGGLEVKTDDLASSKAEPVSWLSLPRKDQLAVMVLIRLSEPLARTSTLAYLFYQLKWFDPSLSDAVIASQAGVLHASFTAAQLLTAVWWGQMADSSRFGRKAVLLAGLAGTAISSVGYAFSTTFASVVFFRILGGLANGNGGVVRTIMSEIIREKKYQSRAFLLLPLTFNVGSAIGPLLGGMMADPAGTYPSMFGGVGFFQKLPYALPNLGIALIVIATLIVAWLTLEETLESRIDKRDVGLELGRSLSAIIRTSSWLPGPLRTTSGATRAGRSMALASQDDDDEKSQQPRPRTRRYTQRLPFRRIFTRNVVLNLGASFLLALHNSSFNTLWPIFLSTPVYHDSGAESPFDLSSFMTGGMGLQTRRVAVVMLILGLFGVAVQLILYPSLSARLGTVGSLRIFSALFPVAYFLTPYLTLVASNSESSLTWIAIVALMFLRVLGHTFAQPAQTILINNSTPHPSVLGTVHGVAQAVNSLARTVGSMVCGYLFGLGLANGVAGVVWWGLSGMSLLGLVLCLHVRDGSGHEIWLEGDDEME